MSEVSQPWSTHKLDELFEVLRNSINPSQFPGETFCYHSIPAWDQCGGPVMARGKEIESNKNALTEPCVLVSKLNPRKPRVSVVEQVSAHPRHCASTEFVCLHPITEQSLRYWGFYFSGASFSRKLESYAIGSTNSHTRARPSDFLGWEVNVPPRFEQAKIAQILDTLDTQIHQTETLIAKLETVKQGLLTDLLTRGIDENGQLRPPPEEAPELYKDSLVGFIPKEWVVSTFPDVASLPSGQVSPLASEYRDMPLVAPDHIEPGTGKLIRLETARDQGAISGKYLFYPGDVLYSKIRPYLRKMWLADMEGLCSADMYPLRPREGVASSFLLLLVMGENFSKFSNSVSMRTGIPKINREELAAFQCAVPSGAEQQKIEKSYFSIARRIEVEQHNLGKLMTEKSGVTDDLLTGRVRVTSLLGTVQTSEASCA